MSYDDLSPAAICSRFSSVRSSYSEKVKNDIVVFAQDPFYPKLETHPLHGKLNGFWSFTVAGKNRILFQFLNNEKSEAVFLDVGDHSIYR